jgi:hypothetical protein
MGSQAVLEAQMFESHDPFPGFCPGRELYAGLALSTGNHSAFLFASAKKRFHVEGALLLEHMK